MAVTLPGADVRLLPGKSRTLLDARWITVHTMVGTLAGTEGYFTPAGRPYSHFGTGPGGELRQWQDLAYRAASDLEGNPYSISFENADSGPGFPRWSGSDVPAFTDAQAQSLIVGLSWCCHRFGLPRDQIRTSCPHERGIGWHRLGVDPYRAPGCLRWSSAYGKACPGDRRIAQLRTEIIPDVSAPQEVDMPTAQEIADAVWSKVIDDPRVGLRASATQAVGDIFHHARRAAAGVDAAKLAQAIAEQLPVDVGEVKVADIEAAVRKVFADAGEA